jgi:transposase
VLIESERDLETLRQAALLLDRENRHLLERVDGLHRELAALRGIDPSQLTLAMLRELEALRPPSTAAGEGKGTAPGATSDGEATEKTPRRGHGPRSQEQLEIETVAHILAEGSRACPACGGKLEAMGVVEDSEEVTVIERRFVLRRHERMKYRCRCNGAVVTAPGPDKLIPGGRYAPEFAVTVAIDKYLDHLPLERQVRRMARSGLMVTSQTLWDQIDALARHLEPSYAALGERALTSPVLHVDETRWPLLDRQGSSPHSVFGLVTGEVAYYRIPSSKSAQAAAKILGGYAGTVVADGYAVYQKLARDGPFRLAHCWAHVVRKFREIEEQHPQECGRMLGWIGQLYEIEAAAKGDDDAMMAKRLELRQAKSRPVLEQIRAWCFAHGALPRSGLGKAMCYVLKYWDGLTVFVDDPAVPLDNNAVERALRGPVVGRKNHYGSKSKRGTKVAAILYSLCETAKLCGVDPHAYLGEACIRAIRAPGAVTLPLADGSILRR